MKKLANRKTKRRPSRSGKGQEKVSCNLCGAKNECFFLESPTGRKKKGKFSTTSQVVAGERIVKCKNCGLIYVNPRSKQRLIVNEYSQEERTYLQDARARTDSFKRSLRVIREYQQSGRVLDVGCAAGFFLKAAREAGFEVGGVEPNKWLAAWGKKNLSLNIFPWPFERTSFPANYFDLVTFWDVLEHLTDPLRALIRTNKVLKKGGVVVVNYPDIGSWLARVMGRNWWFVVSGHLYYFTPKTMAMMLKKAGFRLEKDSFHFQRLSLGYLLTRLSRYQPGLGEKLASLSRKVGIGSLVIPYWAGQRTVVARKIF